MTGPDEQVDFDSWADEIIALSKQYPNVPASELIRIEMLGHIRAAKTKVPDTRAHWETAAFFGYAVAASVRLLAEGVITDYRQFRQIAWALWGWKVRPYIPALFGAAVLHPSLTQDYAEELLGTITAYDLLARDE